MTQALHDAAEQAAAMARARTAHDVDLEPKPDPRELLRGLTNNAPTLKRGAR